MGNSNEQSGDGFKYKGRGIIQLTGKDNYKKFSQDIFKNDSMLDTPEALKINKVVAIHSACWFWKTNNLNLIADKDDCVLLTKKINGGTIGIDDRLKRLSSYKLLFV